jgi:DNA replication licensing factor MCM6
MLFRGANAVQDQILMPIRGEGLADNQGQGLATGKVVYVMHPNCSVEDM